MIYLRQCLLLIMLLLLTCQAFAFYHEEWHTLNTDSQYAAVDKYSINKHNNSVYYAVKYCKQTSEKDIDNCLVFIVQNKDNKVGIVHTYKYKEYADILIQSTKNSHPAYVAVEAESLKELDKNKILYSADEYVKQYMSEKGSKTNTETMYEMQQRRMQENIDRLKNLR